MLWHSISRSSLASLKLLVVVRSASCSISTSAEWSRRSASTVPSCSESSRRSSSSRLFKSSSCRISRARISSQRSESRRQSRRANSSFNVAILQHLLSASSNATCSAASAATARIRPRLVERRFGKEASRARATTRSQKNNTMVETENQDQAGGKEAESAMTVTTMTGTVALGGRTGTKV